MSEFHGTEHATLQANRLYPQSVRQVRPAGRTDFFNHIFLLPHWNNSLPWRLWVTHVLQPGNKKVLHDVLVNKAHLLIDDDMPDPLLQFCAHVAGFDIVIQRWAAGDHREHLSVVSHPRNEMNEYAARSFAALKQDQAQLLALTASRSRRH